MTPGVCPFCERTITSSELSTIFWNGACEGLSGTIFSFNCPDCGKPLQCETETCITMLANTIEKGC